jgi:hypothetical protein
MTEGSELHAAGSGALVNVGDDVPIVPHPREQALEQAKALARAERDKRS